MTPQQSTGFQMRFREGEYRIYLVKADGQEIPAEKQRVVYSNKSRALVQPVSDALNSGLLTTISRVIILNRSANAQ